MNEGALMGGSGGWNKQKEGGEVDGKEVGYSVRREKEG